MAESKSEKGTWIPESIQIAVIQSGLDLNHAWIVSKAISFHHAKRDFHASNTHLADRLGKSVRQIQRYIKDLEYGGWLYVNTAKSIHGTSRKLIPTENALSILRGDIDVMPRGDADVTMEVTPMSPNNKGDNTAVNNTVLTATSFFENDADVFYKSHLRKLIGEDLDISPDDEVFDFYDAASQWAECVRNVDIPRKPNTSIIQSLLGNEAFMGFSNTYQVIEFLDGRYQERNVINRDKPVNLSWLVCAEMDDAAKDGILSSEGWAEQWSNNAVKLLAEGQSKTSF